MSFGGTWPGLSRQDRGAQGSGEHCCCHQQGRHTSQAIPRGSPLGSPWRAVLAWPTAASGGWGGGQGEIRGLVHCVLLDNCCDQGLERSLGATGVCFAAPKLRERAAGCRGREGKRARTQQNTKSSKLGSFGAWEPFPLPSSSVSTLARQVCPRSWCKPPQPFGRAVSWVGKQEFPVSKRSQL